MKAAQARLSLHLSKCNFVGNHTSQVMHVRKNTYTHHPTVQIMLKKIFDLPVHTGGQTGTIFLHMQKTTTFIWVSKIPR